MKFTNNNPIKERMIFFISSFLVMYVKIKRIQKMLGKAIIAVVFVPIASAIASVEKYSAELFLYLRNV